MNSKLPLRPLGDSGLNVSAMALGTVKFGRNTQVKYPTSFDLPSDEQLVDLLSLAQQLGINLLDTAPAYGSSESRLGALLTDQRKQWLLCTKVGETFVNGRSSYDFREAAVVASIDASLRKLNTDYLDLVLIHSNGDDLGILEQQQTLGTLLDLKAQGVVRAVGLSHKTLAGGQRALELGADVLMTELSQAERAMAPLVAQCAQQSKGVLVKKALGSGHSGVHSLGLRREPTWGQQHRGRHH